MSALMGILSLDGAPVARERIERMACAMPELAPDGTDIWIDGPFGCAFQRCDDGPAPRPGPQPIHDATAGLVVMASGRLDNRDDLGRDVAGSAGAAMSDAEIVLAAVRRHGIEVMPRLEGDLDVVVYDTRERRLYVARSPVDLRSFLWWTDRRQIVFAHYPKQLFAAGRIPVEVDEGMAGEMLAGFWLTPAGTLWRDVHRLPPAHALSADRGKVDVRRWYSPDCSLLRLRSDEEYAEAFNHLFDAALKRRISGATGILLSGGLDSSSIACRAAELAARGDVPVPLEPFSVQLEDENDESPWMDEVEARTGVRTNRFRPSPFDWDHACAWSRTTLTLPVRPNAATLLESMPEFRARDIRVVLLGEGGDEWLGGSLDYLADLLRRGELRDLIGDGLLATQGLTAWRRARRIAGHSIGPWISPRRRARAVLPHVSPDPQFGDAWIASSWARRIGLRERRMQVLDLPAEFGLVQRGLFHSFMRGRAALNMHSPQLTAATQHVTLAMPFHDRRLAEFAFRLPGVQLRRGAVGKHVLRQAMRGTLPERLERRPDKANFSSHMRAGLEEGKRQLGSGEWLVVQAGWVDRGGLDELWQQLPEDVTYVGPLWFIVALEVFLRHAAPAARDLYNASR